MQYTIPDSANSTVICSIRAFVLAVFLIVPCNARRRCLSVSKTLERGIGASI